MTKEEFRELSKEILILDGATGTNLSKRGMPAGVCPEKWILKNPNIMKELQKEYYAAGSNIVLAPTFTSNRIKLKEYGLDNDIVEVNRELLAISQTAREEYIKESGESGDRLFVAADISMTGKQLKPLGPLDTEELIEVYKEQLEILKSGVDLIIIETMMSLAETRAALIAAREICDLPVLCSLTFDETGRTLYGTDPKTAMGVLQSLGADAVGCNCSVGPDRLCSVIKEMAEIARVPIIAKPNAGLPVLNEDNSTSYDVTPEEFAKDMSDIVRAGASIIGGCCGTTPDHIRALLRAVKDIKPELPDNRGIRYLSSEQKTLIFDLDSPFMIVGERINPTGKKKLQEELRNDSYGMVYDFAVSQYEAGASLLDINVGMGGIDEKKVLIKAMEEVISAVSLPLVIDSSDVEAMEAALRRYPGKALVNSISLEDKKINGLLPIVKKYGAMFLLLPLSDKGLPGSLEEKKDIINRIIGRAHELGFSDEDIVVDGLVQTVGANPQAGLETLETIRYCHDELKLPTICGLSNISFGLPERIYVNTAFLNMAILSGLTMAIMNPSQVTLVTQALASDLLLNKPGADIRYIEYINTHEITKPVPAAAKDGASSSSQNEKKDGSLSGKDSACRETAGNEGTKKESEGKTDTDEIYRSVLSGNRSRIIRETEKALNSGTEAGKILNDSLLPAINEVGKLFEKGKYFLPQLIKSAETMSASISILEPFLKEAGSGSSPVTIVIATVKGDIHDIGKNLVVLMLKNYGFNVIDLGKDVDCEAILDAAQEHNADIIALSALMTTTMTEMEKVVKRAGERNIRAKIIIGGAVTTQEYCELINADGYSKDAQEAVILVKKLMDMIR
ncbi:MAG: homocysteine S-methyltransferase family protein [Lachnospiraceae bacterium]|nr:homocysteine S-methyltransferase family protein [Lachnospiraceae bacterium]